MRKRAYLTGLTISPVGAVRLTAKGRLPMTRSNWAGWVVSLKVDILLLIM